MRSLWATLILLFMVIFMGDTESVTFASAEDLKIKVPDNVDLSMRVPDGPVTMSIPKNLESNRMPALLNSSIVYSEDSEENVIIKDEKKYLFFLMISSFVGIIVFLMAIFYLMKSGVDE